MNKNSMLELSQQELNDLYYCVETINRRDFSPGMNARLNLLGDKISEEIYKLAAKEKQLEDDKLRHEMNFKYVFAKHGDY